MMVMENRIYYWAGVIIFLVTLVTFFIVNATFETKNVTLCKQLRIRPFTEKFFTWGGIVELNQKGEYQPRCI